MTGLCEDANEPPGSLKAIFWFRQLKELGQSKFYKDKQSECGIWLRSIFGLTYLDPTEVDASFVDDFMSCRSTEIQQDLQHLISGATEICRSTCGVSGTIAYVCCVTRGVHIECL
ncbi:hypothetical protein ANN_07898 [Periplaneta americana]|uniref:Uncharacterized protein n=1 Tax=Periplaneta americana TaxID=6978 RepID=A0ABQ8T256_PERAM|nr:hypothetical protein ANN_07898 [Periplaneta americana]